MQTTNILALAGLALGVLLPSAALAAPVAPINAVVGDVSWLEHTGHLPTAEEARSRDEERHRVHLAWIERKLRARSVTHLAPSQRATRARLLDALAAYRERGVHPANDRATRLPRFLDPEGRICAVGHLMEVTAGRALVERINARWEHDYLLDIDDPELDAWIAESGFTARELASIQPTGYAGPIGSFDAGDGDAWLAGIGAGVLFAVNAAFMVLTGTYAEASERARERLAITQLTLGLVQLLASGLALGFSPRMSDDYRGPVMGSSIAFGLLATFQITAGGVTLATAP